MKEPVFISDLHLHPEKPDILARFTQFIAWAKIHAQQVYILGDFFHAWVGDDDLTQWSLNIAKQVRSLHDSGIEVYFMHGNRDFLLGPRFAALAGWTLLTEPTYIHLDKNKIMLAHGDSYCTNDLGHQRLRRLTRNRLFSRLFLSLPLTFRQQVANQLRKHSMSQSKSMAQMDVVESAVLQQMTKHKVHYLIHGHTHKPGLSSYKHNNQDFFRYVLSDWDDRPQILSYNNAKGLYFSSF